MSAEITFTPLNSAAPSAASREALHRADVTLVRFVVRCCRGRPYRRPFVLFGEAGRIDALKGEWPGISASSERSGSEQS